MQVKIKRYREVKKGTLQGYLDVHLPEIGWTIKGCGLFKNEERTWVNLPARTYNDPQGVQRYAYFIEMPKDEKEKFCKDVLEDFEIWKHQDHPKDAFYPSMGEL